MQKKTNVFKILLALAFVLAFLASCGTVPKSGSSGSSSGSVSVSATVTNLTAKKLLEFKKDKIDNLYADAFVYENDKGEKGIMSYDGKDTHARFDYVQQESGYFIVSEKYGKFESATDPKELNIFGLRDGSGELILSPNYACFEFLNSRYIAVYEAKERVYITEDDGEYVYKWKYFMSTSRDAEAPTYTYHMFYYDVIAGKVVSESNIKYFGYSYGNEDKSFDDGSYVIRTTEKDTVYDLYDEILFDYNPNEYQVVDLNGGYYVAEKVVSGESKYLLLDSTGAKVSAEFDKSPDVYGDLVAVYEGGKYNVFKLDGTAIVDNAVDSVYYDELSKDLVVLRSGDDDYTFVNGEGKVLLNATASDKLGIDVAANYGLASQKSKEENTDEAYYNFDAKEYSISAYRTNYVGNLLVTVSDGDSRYDLIDATNGKMLCEGYSDYEVGNAVNGCCYVAAQRTEGGYDIYKVQNKIDAVKDSLEDDAAISQMQLDKIYKTKEEMFTELETALKEAGLSATIDRDNGEIAFDAAVVFAGDSSEISADGKKLLDAFVKAYSSVLSNDKYDGFISKTIVEGHTAPLANSTYESGLPLSQDRADKVKEYCKTVDAALAETLEAVGYSNSMPIYNPDGTINQDASRRVTFKCVINNEF